jgi:hypothetical protein
LQKDLEQARNKSGLPALTPGAQALAATGPESTQPDLDKDKASAITTGLATLFGGAGAAGAGMNMGPLNDVLRPSTRLGIAAPGAVLPAAVGATGAALSTGAANALSNATPEQLDQLSSDIGSDTGLAAAITNAPNRPPEKPPMSYSDQMANVGKFILGHPDIRKPAAIPEPEPGIPSALANEHAKLVAAAQSIPRPTAEETPEETPTAIAEEPKKGGMDYSDMMLKMGLGLMAGKSPNALTNVGEAGIGALQMSMAEKKAAAEQAKMQAETEYARAHAGYLGQLADIKTSALDTKQNIALAQMMAQYENKLTAAVGMSETDKALARMRFKNQAVEALSGQGQQAAGAPVVVPQGVTVKQTG